MALPDHLEFPGPVQAIQKKRTTRRVVKPPKAPVKRPAPARAPRPTRPPRRSRR